MAAAQQACQSLLSVTAVPPNKPPSPKEAECVDHVGCLPPLNRPQCPGPAGLRVARGVEPGQSRGRLTKTSLR